MKAIVLYSTKSGNTQRIADEIASELNCESLRITKSNPALPVNLIKYDLIVIGSPNHMGSHTKKVKKFITNLSKAPVKGESFAVFDTYQSKDFEKAVKKLEKQITETIPDMKKALSGLSIQVTGMKGPILEDDLPKCKDFGVNLSK